MGDPRDNQINYVELPASQPENTRSFFETAFGWEFQEWGPDYLSFRDGKLDGGFYRAETSARVSSGSALVILYHADLEGARQAVLDAGGSIEKDIFSFPGGRRFHFLDPSGNEFAVWSEV
jgi:predicted enzyme related to lactoylglutathione lyase